MQFLPSSSCVNSTLWIHHMDANETYLEEARWEVIVQEYYELY